MNRKVILSVFQGMVAVFFAIASFASAKAAQTAEPNQPIGEAKGIHPGRVVWAYDAQAVNWKNPKDDGNWWQNNHVKQDRVDAMMARTVCDLTGESTVSAAWDKLFRHLNKARGKGEVGYKPGEKVVIKPNWVGMIYLEGHVNASTYNFLRRENYMNTSPQMIIALLRQLTREAGVRPGDITVCDTLAYLVNEYYDILHAAFPEVRFEDYGGKFGRVKAKMSTTPLYWSSRPGKAQDYLPTCFAEAEYIVNFANFKAHTGGGVTLCFKNHYGSLVRWPVQQGYYDIHPNCFSKQQKIYRPLVDLVGHEHLGGKTVLYLVDGLFSGVHPRDPVPQTMKVSPFNGGWTCSLFASQDPVAIDSVALDFLVTEWPDIAKPGTDDYLHEAALANDPPSGTFYDPNHSAATKRLASLGAHEHWNNPQEKKYSRNLGTGKGIELLAAEMGK